MSPAKRSHRALRICAWVFTAVIIFILVAPALLYIPLVQDIAKDIAVSQVRKSLGWDLSVERVRLRWPLRLSVDNAVVVPTPGDTMLTAKRLDVGVAIWPLIHGDLNVDYARLDSAFYQLGTADSTLWLRAHINRFDLHPARLTFKLDSIALSEAALDGADISLIMRPDSSAAPSDSTVNPLVVNAALVSLRNVRFAMSMRPTIDSINVAIPSAALHNGSISLAAQRIKAAGLSVDSISGFYLFPKPDADVAQTTAPVDSVISEPWTITADSLRLSATDALYAMAGASPAPGLDMNYIRVSDVDIRVDNFFNRGAVITVPVSRLFARERCGLTLDASGTFAITPDSLMQARGFQIATNTSSFSIDASMAMGDLSSNPSLPISLLANGRLSLADVALALPAMRPTFAQLPPPNWLQFDADIHGSPAALEVELLSASYPGLLDLNASGRILNPLNPNRIAGSITLDGSLSNGERLRRSPVVAKMLGPSIHIPGRLAVNGSVSYSPGPKANGNLSVTANDGSVAASGSWNASAEAYDASIRLNRFPVAAFMPDLGVGDVSANISAKGHGYNPLSPRSQLNLDADVTSVVYNHRTLSDIKLLASVADSRAQGLLRSLNHDADFDIEFDASLSDSAVDWDIDGDLRHLDLMALGLADSAMNGSMQLSSSGRFLPKSGAINASAAINDLDWDFGSQSIVANRLDLTANLADSLMDASVSSGDLRLNASAFCGLDSLMAKVAKLQPVILAQIKNRRLNVDSLRLALPPLNITLAAGSDNFVARYMAAEGISWQRIGLTAQTDSTIRITGRLLGLKNGSTAIDTISLNALQRGKYLIYNARMGNRPGTMDEFARLNLNGFVGDDRLSMLLRQQNIKGQTGFSLGLLANVSDSTASVKFLPYNPTIAYKPWTVNRDNFITYNFSTDRLNADLNFTGQDGSFLRIFTERSRLDSIPPAPGQLPYNDIILKISNVKVQDWLAVNPFAPPIKGDLQADLRLNWNRKALTGIGNIGVNDFFYDNQRVGSFLFDVNLFNDPASKAVRADMALMVDSVKTLTLKGLINDSTAPNPFLLDVKLIHLPLEVANPFLPKDMARLSGSLNGTMDMTGSPATPILNGFLEFDSAKVQVPMIGQDFKFSSTRIPVDSNLIRFNNFEITAANDNPLKINGIVDASRISDISLNLDLNAHNMMLINRQRPRGADAYGKAYADIDANIHGSLSSLLWVDAKLKVLGGTNATYVIPGGTSSLQSLSSGNSDMVRFVNFNDTTQVQQADSIKSVMGLILNAELIVDEGTTLGVDLSADGKNKVSLQPQGSLTFSMSPLNSGRLTGRLTFNKGFVRYTPPLMSEKLFDLSEGSYVAFNGDMFNPILNIHAVDVIKANVTQQGQNSRLVNFDVSVDITNTLQNMNVAFDLSTNDDITVQNELQGMSREQRANQAMNMLLYNVYSGPGTTGNASLGGNALFSFLESKINSWAASTIPGVDISFGIEQYDRTYEGATSTATSYSYQVSKSLFNDRFKIVVGGNYTTDANADENFSQNIINNISFEYLLNRAGTMYVRIFRHTGYESILEGEVTQTGVGFVFRRKLDSLRDLFRWRRKKESVPTVVIPANNSSDEPSR